MFKLVLVVFVILLLSARLHGYDRITGQPFASRSEVIGNNGMAATSQPLATQVALDVLKQGGSAVDAAIAANAMLCLVEPTGCGLGGDLFAIVWDAEKKELVGLNGSGRSPRALTIETLRKQGDRIPAYGALPISVPGCVDGWFELHGRYGKLAMSKVLGPTIRYAREGAPISELIAYYWGRSAERLGKYEGFADTFMPGGSAPRKGTLFKNPRLAKTLEALATDGRDAFYKGDLARTMDAFMKRVGGYLRYEDLASHSSTWVEPQSTDYRGYRVWQLPPNGQGIAVLQMLNILELHDVGSMGFGSVEYLHLFTEAKKLVFEDRARFYSDPEFTKLPIKGLISKSYAKQRAQLIDSSRAATRVEAGNPALESGDTVYLTVADKDGNMVSLIQSNYRGMGCGLAAADLGFIFQNRGELFSLADGHANVYAPGKRPFHTIIPGFVTRDGTPWLSFGVMGGSTQPQAQVQVLVNLIDFGMNLQEAGDAARVVHRGSSSPTGDRMTNGGELNLESGFDPRVVEALRKRGHRIGDTTGVFGGYQAIKYQDGVYYGASESRKDGQAAGY